MGTLILRFDKFLNQGSNRSSELYGDSLRKQYSVIESRTPLEKRASNFEEFIRICFPETRRKYYFSLPSFNRTLVEDKQGIYQYLNNVVIRPELTAGVKAVLPDGQNILLIGDIAINKKNSSCYFRVKGLELVDAKIQPINDVSKTANADVQFDSTHSSCLDPVLTMDFVGSLISSCFTVADPKKTRGLLNKWEDYLKFREYYLDEQSGTCFKLNSCGLLRTYLINKRQYLQNPERFDENRLVLSNQDKIGENIFLTDEHATNSQFFPLVQITIDRNKKAFLATGREYKGKIRIEEEAKLKTLTNGNVFLAKENVTTDPKQYERVKRDGLTLGERIGFKRNEVLPEEHIDQIKANAELSIQKEKRKIDEKYELKVRKEVKALIDEERAKLSEELEKEVSKYDRELAERIDQDVAENKDAKVNERYQAELATIRKKNPKPTVSRLKGEDNDSFLRRRDSSDKEHDAKIKELIDKINIKALYLERNDRLVSDRRSQLSKELDRKIQELTKQSTAERTRFYVSKKTEEFNSAKESIESQRDKDIATATEDETILRFTAYFALENELDPNSFDNVSDKISSFGFIGYDNRAEKAIIDREKNALDAFMNGFVKNPYLSTYLFSPENLPSVTSEYEVKRWYLDSLNDLQKQAVQKAMASNGLFLLQGPPGTGKTQVIAETIAHLVKEGKKVLVSSETHKAIDNVFDRLPKIPEIIPVRLIPSTSQKKSDYAPEALLDNFYRNVYDQMDKSVLSFEDFEKTRDSFEDEMNKLKLLYSRNQNIKDEIASTEKKINENNEEISKKNDELSDLKDKAEEIKAYSDILSRTRRHIDKSNLAEDSDININYLGHYLSSIQGIFDDPLLVSGDQEKTLKIILNLTDQQIDDDMLSLDSDKSSALLSKNISILKEKLNECYEKLDDGLPKYEEEAKELRKKLKQLLNERNSSKKQVSNELTAIFDIDALLKRSAREIKDAVHSFQEKIEKAKKDVFQEIDTENASKSNEINAIVKEEERIRLEIKEIKDENAELKSDGRYAEYESNSTKLQISISDFFNRFNIHSNYDSVDEAFDLIEQAWKDLSDNFEQKKEENLKKIPIYKDISAYLKNPEVIAQDKKEFTKPLFELANVIGITCTTDSRIRQSKNKATMEYGLDDVNIKRLGIDVVIIDEVSKCSFLDLLIPILYGKTVILVGDHRQLPPMYDLGKLREDAFESLDHERITYEKNQEYKEMYEDCFFKKIFEKIGDDYKIMLRQQYRCHSQIMDVFNHFYSGQLQIGFDSQNKRKEHNISLTANGIPTIVPEKHVYFIDCKTGYENRAENSTSISNKREAEVVCSLISDINDYFEIHHGMEKLSMGVICTYGDQARLIKNKLKGSKLRGFSQLNNERIIVSTVDDFQGDERDIIFLSLVRNPIDPTKSDPGFINAYQRINVALSRARRLLVIVGNRKYVESRGVINLPDINGDKLKDKKRCRIYEEIIGTIRREGKLLSDTDVIAEKGEDR